MKKTVAVLLSLTMLFSFSACKGKESGTSENGGSAKKPAQIEWKAEGGTLTIHGEGDMPDYVYPGEKNASPEKISPWTEDSETVETVVIEEGTTSIGDFAFFECKKLTSVEIPDGVIEIGYNAFTRCESLTEVALPDSVQIIGMSAFSFCGNLTGVEIPSNVTSLGPAAFAGCESLTEIVIPDKITVIDKSTFFGCTNLAKIVLPRSVKQVEDSAFSGCDALTIYGEAGSYAETFAKENGIPFKVN